MKPAVPKQDELDCGFTDAFEYDPEHENKGSKDWIVLPEVVHEHGKTKHRVRMIVKEDAAMSDRQRVGWINRYIRQFFRRHPGEVDQEGNKIAKYVEGRRDKILLPATKRPVGSSKRSHDGVSRPDAHVTDGFTVKCEELEGRFYTIKVDPTFEILQGKSVKEEIENASRGGMKPESIKELFCTKELKDERRAVENPDAVWQASGLTFQMDYSGDGHGKGRKGGGDAAVYRLVDIDFDSKPFSETEANQFKLRQPLCGMMKMTTPGQYAVDRYFRGDRSQVIERQPMLIGILEEEYHKQSRKSKKDLAAKARRLIPQYAFRVGQSQEQQADFTFGRNKVLATQQTNDQVIQKLGTLVKDLAAGFKNDLRLSLDLEGKKPVGKRLGAPAISVGPRTNFVVPSSGEWRRDAQHASLPENDDYQLRNWAIVICSPKNEHDLRRDVEDFHQMLQKSTRSLASIGLPRPKLIHEPGRASVAALNRVLQRQNWAREQFDLVLIVLPGKNNKDEYAAVKQAMLLNTSAPPHQGIAEKNFRDKKLEVLGSMWQQALNKVGKTFRTIHTASNGQVPFEDVDGGVMVCGIAKNKDVVAFVWSTNKDNPGRNIRWQPGHKSQQQAGGSGISGDWIRLCMDGALKSYADENSRYPGVVIVYRAGESEAQKSNVFKMEAQNGCNAAFGNFWTKENGELFENETDQRPPDAKPYRPKFAFVLTTQRNDFHCFQMGQNDNPDIGTVIDTYDVVGRMEWYAVSHAPKANQGATKMPKYAILHDTEEVMSDKPSSPTPNCELLEYPDFRPLQRLTYHLCALDELHPGMVKVPNVLSYAERCCRFCSDTKLNLKTLEDNMKEWNLESDLRFL